MNLEEFVVQDTLGKMEQVLNDHKNIMISISGGSDSDCLIELFEAEKREHTLHYVFFDTGLEYEATKKHLLFLESKYNIKVKRVRAKTPIPKAIKENGSPLLSKNGDEFLSRMQKHNFDFKNDGKKTLEELYKKYPNCKGALHWWCQENITINISNKAKYWIIENANKLPKISNKCCKYAKKDVSSLYIKENPDITCVVTGMRQEEGGSRAVSLKNTGCYFKNSNGQHFYHPLNMWSDKTKAHFKETRGIVNSDCYEVWGMVRTGCCGCPYGSNFEEEIKLIERHEPKLSKAIKNLFGASYEIKREINSGGNKSNAKNTLGKKKESGFFQQEMNI